MPGHKGLAKWFKQDWVDIGSKKKGGGFAKCGRSKLKADRKRKYPKCVPAAKAARMTESQIKQEADRTGGTRHAGEMTKAAGRAVPSSHSNVRRYGRADGGMVGLDYLTRRL